jgi:gamma-glutamyltranspeptidase/glutathione hydrolase
MINPHSPRTAVAAGHPATTDAAAAILQAGGSAADAAVAAIFAASVAETIFTGLGGGGFATYYDVRTDEVTCLDFFVAVPGLGSDRVAGPMTALPVTFGGVEQSYSIGAASVAVPGVPAGCGEIHRRWGRLPWPEVIAPALALATGGVYLPATHAVVLGAIAGGMTLGDGAAVYASSGKLATTGERLLHPGLDRMLQSLAVDGPSAFYTGPVAEAMVEIVAAGGGVLTHQDLSGYRVTELEVGAAAFAGGVVRARTDLNRCRDAFGQLGDLAGLPAPSRARLVARTLGGPQSHGDTTNVSVVDADGNACVATTTLGLGAGVWVPGHGVHLNSMLGEGELIVGSPVAGERMNSMMCPLVVTDDHGLVAAAGAAGASRIRTALVHSLVGDLVEGLSPAEAIALPRFHPVGQTLHAEPGIPASTLSALREDGWTVREWPALEHYFGGASMVTRRGAGADPRRDGAAITL